MYDPKQYSHDMNSSINVARIISKIGFNLIDHIRLHSSECRDSEFKNISQLILQMELVKLESIINLVSKPILLDGRIPYVDPMSIVTIERGMYELLAMHHVLFIENKTDEFREFSVKIWKVQGLSNRKNIMLNSPKLEKYEPKKDEEIKEINKQIKEIKSSRIYICTSDKGRNKIDEACKNLKPIFVTEKDTDVSITLVTLADAYKYLYPHNSGHSADKYIYKMMSFQSHPTFMGILQFGQQQCSSESYWTAPVKGATHFCAKLINEVSATIPQTNTWVQELDTKYNKLITMMSGDSIFEV